MDAHQGWNGGVDMPHPGSNRFGISLNTATGTDWPGENNATAMVENAKPMFEALDKWIKAQPASMGISGSFKGGVVAKPKSGTWVKPGAPEHQVSLPWDDPHHDTEIGTEHLVSMSKCMTKTAINEGPGDAGKKKMATAGARGSRTRCASS